MNVYVEPPYSEIGSTKKSIGILKAKSGTTKRTVNINMKKCHEDISVYTVATDGGDSIGSSATKGSKVNGSTPNVTHWKKNHKYIDICGSINTGKIVSYDKQ